MQERTQREATWLGGFATIGMVVLLLVAYRSLPVLVLGLLPLASAGLAGLAAVSAVFGTVHGITLAFGFTLIGVAQDYPMHLFSHQHRGVDPAAQCARAVADPRDRGCEHLRRLSRLPVLGCARTRAAVRLHGRRVSRSRASRPATCCRG